MHIKYKNWGNEEGNRFLIFPIGEYVRLSASIEKTLKTTVI